MLSQGIHMKILIFGSCVTRDAFTFDKSNEFTLDRYFARTSLATAFNSPPINDVYTEQLNSAFQKKIVNAELKKEFKEYIIKNNFDYLVVDFIDDRYSVFKFKDGRKTLLSAELCNTDFKIKNQENGDIIQGFSDKWFEEWKKECLEFIQIAKEYGFINKIILNKAYWTNIEDKNESFYDLNKVNEANRFLKKQYDFFEKLINKDNVINYPDSLLIANNSHMWGLSPFHYVDDFYISLLLQLKDTEFRKLVKKQVSRSKNMKKNNLKQHKKTEEKNEITSQLDNIESLSHHQMLVMQQIKNSLSDNLNNSVVKYENDIKRLSEELEKSKNELHKKQTELTQVTQKIKQAKEQVENTLSFKLGHTLIYSTKSFRNFISLPKDLFDLALLAKERRQNKGKPLAKTNIVTPISYPKVDGPFKKKYRFKFISILDEISHTSFESEFKLFPLNKASFETQIKGSTSLGFFIESCWKGNFGAWEYAFTSPNLQHQNAQNLLKSLSIAKERNFPIIFWNKEDPMHYEKFLPISSKCDIIFTTDSNKVKDYQRDVPNAKVEALLFAANIHICNPANRFRVEQENICFAGSYYGVGHDDRKKQMDALLPTIIKFKGAIYDRMSQVGSERYAYPRKYRKFIRPAVPFREIVNVYRQFKIFLNVNTITDSPTMMSRRVYELLACGTPVISTPSLAIDEQFKGIVQVASNAKEANKIAKRLLENEWEWRKISHLGYREVMLKHTYEHRAIQIAQALGQDVKEEIPLASIVVASNRPHFIDRIVKNVTEQVYPNIEVIVIAQKYTEEQFKELETKLKTSNKKFKAVHIIRNDSDDTLGSRLNQGIALSKGEYVAKFDDDDFYFPNYLQDALIPFKFGDYGVVGKREIFVYLENLNKTLIRFKNQYHMNSDFIAGPTLIFSRKALDKLKFGDLNKGEDSNILEQAKKNNIKIYASDSFNFVQFRSKDAKNHTWQVEDKFFTEKGSFVGNGLAEEITKL